MFSSFPAPNGCLIGALGTALTVSLGTPLAASAQDTTTKHLTTHSAPQPVELKGVSVTAKRFSRARNALSPTTGSSKYRFDEKSLHALPLDSNTPLSQVLLQAPGVVSDSQGQLHVRGDHAGLQYRINGVTLPEGITGFGQVLGTRLASNIDLLTGALPAQYGERTAGVIDITTKQNLNGGHVGIFGGTHGTVSPSFDYGLTSQNGTTAFLTGSYLHSDWGTEPPTAAYHPIHDSTEQARGFGYLATNLAPKLRLSAMAGTAYNRFDLPDSQGLMAGFAPPNATIPASRDLDARQFERNTFGILALQGLLSEGGSWQIAAFNRISSVNYEPDPNGGDLYYTGVSGRIKRKATTWGLQGDISIPLGEHHTLRAGFIAQTENDRNDNMSTVFQTDANGNTDFSKPPVTIVDNNPKNGNKLEALYVQDQWDMNDALTLNYGVRVDHLNSYITTSQLSPRLGMVWYIDPQTTFHAGYSRYFTPPQNALVSSTSIAKFQGTTNASEITRNDTVQPERADYFDIGISRQFTDSYHAGVDTYYKYARDLLDLGQFGQALIYAPFNYTHGHVYGVEFTNAFHRGNLNSYLNLAWGRAMGRGISSGQFNLDPDELDYIDHHYVLLDHQQLWTVSAGATYTWHNTLFSLDGIYQDGLRNDGPDDSPNSGKEPSYIVLNLGVAHKLSLGSAGLLTVRLMVTNLLDRKYQIHDGSGIGVFAPQYGQRRGVFLGLEKRI